MLLLLRNSLRTSELDEVTPRLVFPSKKPSARLLASFSRASPTPPQQDPGGRCEEHTHPRVEVKRKRQDLGEGEEGGKRQKRTPGGVRLEPSFQS